MLRADGCPLKEGKQGGSVVTGPFLMVQEPYISWCVTWVFWREMEPPGVCPVYSVFKIKSKVSYLASCDRCLSERATINPFHPPVGGKSFSSPGISVLALHLWDTILQVQGPWAFCNIQLPVFQNEISCPYGSTGKEEM